MTWTHRATTIENSFEDNWGPDATQLEMDWVPAEIDLRLGDRDR